MTTALRRQTQIDSYFGDHGGRYVPDVLAPALAKIEHAHVVSLADPEFTECANRPGPGQGRGVTRTFRRPKYLVRGGAHQDAVTHPVGNIAVLGVVGTLTEEGLHK